jgi:predicted house-cleaning noncanonical NTP pyrophosphatase (MazG superfamily)
VSGVGKLVRDGIPAIIRAQGAEPCTRIASPAEYHRLLGDKLREETDEALAADDAGVLGELADVLEVVYAIAADLGVTAGRLDEVRAAKAAERGTFAGRVVWSGNLEAAR